MTAQIWSNRTNDFDGISSQASATQEAPAQAELRPTCAGPNLDCRKKNQPLQGPLTLPDLLAAKRLRRRRRLLRGRLSLGGLHRCSLTWRNLLGWLPGLIGLGILGRRFQILSRLVKFFVELLAGFPELVHTLTQTPRQFGKLFRTEKNKHDYQDQYPLSRPWRHESDRMHSLELIAGSDEIHPKPSGFPRLSLFQRVQARNQVRFAG
jgi:hypothetical protein